MKSGDGVIYLLTDYTSVIKPLPKDEMSTGLKPSPIVARQQRLESLERDVGSFFSPYKQGL